MVHVCLCNDLENFAISAPVKKGRGLGSIVSNMGENNLAPPHYSTHKEWFDAAIHSIAIFHSGSRVGACEP